jgi:hypothetical protein
MCSVSHHLITHHIIFLQVIHSLRASNRAFADVSNFHTGYWDCLQFCEDTNELQWGEDECKTVCDAMSVEDYRCINHCKMTPPEKNFDKCNCQCTHHCSMVGPGRYITSGPTPLYTRPPRSSEPSTSLSPVPAPTSNNKRSGNASDNANENAHNQVGHPEESSSEPTLVPRESPPSSDFNDTVE